MRDYQRYLDIDYSIIANAQSFYSARGFQRVKTPWTVDQKYVGETKPDGVEYYSTLGGVLVASAEQSFMQMQDQGWGFVGKAQATTPCFRDEQHDELHSPYFMKLELFDNENVTESSLWEMINTAVDFFSTILPVRVEDQHDGSFDIVGMKTGIELGSYGIRERFGYRWIYGTGVALPRVEQTRDKENQAINNLKVEGLLCS